MPTILFVSSSPIDQDRLRLSSEVRDIREALKRSRNREEWKIESNEAATVDDLRRALLDFEPTVVHFSGHGGGEEGLCFEDADGKTHLTDGTALARLFHHFKASLKCVLLNACYSDVQGEVIQKEINYVVGMRSTVDDHSASRFAVSFYDAVFAGSDFRMAFDLGCTALDLNCLPDSNVPVLLTGTHLKPVVLSYTAHIPEIERVLYAYFNTPFGDRAVFTTTGEVLRPTMESFYRSTMHQTTRKIQVRSMKQIGNEHWGVELRGSPESSTMYVRIKDRSVLIEWEAGVGLWSMPPLTYLALEPREPIVARVEAHLDASYYDDFRDLKKSYQSVKLEVEYPGVHLLHGYLKRGTPTFEDLMNILSDGNTHRVTIQIKHVTRENPNTVLIEKMLSPTWIYNSLNTPV